MPPKTKRSDPATILSRAQTDPVWFVQDVLGQEPWSKQREILETLRDHRRTSVRSCHGIGKTFIAASAALWFLFSFPGSRVITTAATFAQVKRLLWHEINQQHRASLIPLGGVCLQTELQLDDGRYAVGLVAAPENSESFAGHHAENLLLVFDEASGVPAPIFEAGEGYMTSAGAKQLLIGNPTRPSGQFYRSHHVERDTYATVHVSAFDTPAFTGEKVSDDLTRRLISKTWVDEKREAWGEDSPLYGVRVLGEFPSGADDAVFSLATVEAAQDRDLPPGEPVVIGCDVARFGSDETVIYLRKGDRVTEVTHYVGRDLMETAGRLAQVHREHGGRIVVDDTGLGGGVTDRLRELGLPVTAYNGGERALDKDGYPNRRSESWFAGADQLKELDIPADEKLLADLVAPTYKLDSRGRRQLEPKDQTKKRLGRSPDRADALLLTLVPPDITPVSAGPIIWS